MDKETIEVPGFRVKTYEYQQPSSGNESLEAVDDGTYQKRHLQFEEEEKLSYIMEVERLQKQRRIDTLKKSKEKAAGDSKNTSNMDLHFIEMVDELPEVLHYIMPTPPGQPSTPLHSPLVTVRVPLLTRQPVVLLTRLPEELMTIRQPVVVLTRMPLVLLTRMPVELLAQLSNSQPEPKPKKLMETPKRKKSQRPKKPIRKWSPGP